MSKQMTKNGNCPIQQFILRHTDVLKTANIILKHQFENKTEQELELNKHSVIQPICNLILQQCSNRYLCANTSLHSYQLAGVQWLLLHYHYNLSCVLCDEMGLGKTIQTLAFIETLLLDTHDNGLSQTNKKKPFLIICPLTVVATWIQEIKRWVPNLNICCMTGNKDERKKIKVSLSSTTDPQSGLSQCVTQSSNDVTCPILCNSLTTDKPLLSAFDLCVTSYEIVQLEISYVASIEWGGIIIDEAHRLKSPTTLLYRTLLKHFTNVFKLLLTGTPIQNHSKEFWALLHFIQPQVFTNVDVDLKQFYNEEHICVHNQSKSTLSFLLDLFILRRYKQQIPSSTWTIPDKEDYTIIIPLTRLQRHLYFYLLNNNKDAIRTMRQHNHTDSPSVLQSSYHLLGQLRYCANHPYLIPCIEQEPFIEGDHIWKSSNKMIILHHIIQYYTNIHQRLLIFSGSVHMLDIVQVDFIHCTYERLDGSIKGDCRSEVVRRFQTHSLTPTDDTPASVFLLSTRAGGVGLNLMCANIIVFIDSDWNPQMDHQAICRSFRQGQTQPVIVFRLVSQDTVDEVIISRSTEKLSLAAYLLQDASQLSSSNIIHLLKHGLVHLVHDDMFEFSNTIEMKIKNCPIIATDDHINQDPIVQALLTLSIPTLLTKKKKQSSLVDHSGVLTTTPLTTELTPCNFFSTERGIYVFEKKDYLNQRKSYKELNDNQMFNYIFNTMNEKNTFISWNQPSLLPHIPSSIISQGHRKKRFRSSSNYLSLSLTNSNHPIFQSVHVPRTMKSNHITSGEMYYVKQDITCPIGNSPHIILHCVDQSGRWPNLGIFSAINSRWGPQFKHYYKDAKEQLDLHKGDIHLIPITTTPFSSYSYVNQSDDSNYCQRKWLALSISHYSHHHLSSTIPSIDLPAFTKSLFQLQQIIQIQPFSIHIPRIGTISKTTNQWYTIEHLFKKYILSKGCNVYVYYFNNNKAISPPVTTHMNTSPKRHRVSANLKVEGTIKQEHQDDVSLDGNTSSLQSTSLKTNQSSDDVWESLKKSTYLKDDR